MVQRMTVQRLRYYLLLLPFSESPSSNVDRRVREVILRSTETVHCRLASLAGSHHAG